VIVLVLPEVGAPRLWNPTHIASSSKESATWGNQLQLAQCPADYTFNKRFSYISYLYTMSSSCLSILFFNFFYIMANHSLASGLNLLQTTRDSRGTSTQREVIYSTHFLLYSHQTHYLLEVLPPSSAPYSVCLFKKFIHYLFSRYYSIIIRISPRLVIKRSYIMPGTFSSRI